ncbi:MAG: ABC transporter permease [Reyranella sp.]|nr:ABC transporter permease [Reyranella sp.]
MLPARAHSSPAAPSRSAGGRRIAVPSLAEPGRSGRTAYWLIMLPAVIMLLLIYLVPLGDVLLTSVTDPRPGLDNYAMLFTSSSVQKALLTTLRIAAITTAAALLMGYLVAYAMRAASSRKQRIMLFCVLLPFWISVLVRSFAWLTLLRGSGPVNNLLVGLGLIDEPLALVRNETGVLIGMIHVMLPYAILTLYANMRGIDVGLVAAARSLGASRLQAFRMVFLPLTRPGLIGAGTLVFILSLGFYVTPALLGGGKVLMIAEYVAVQINDTLRWGLGTMLAATLMIAVLGALWALSRVVDVRRLFGA